MAKVIDCGSSCFLRRKGCKDIKKCACDCGALKAININLYDACITQCNSDNRPQGAQDFKCGFVGGEALYNQYGLLDCGFQVKDSLQYQAYDIQLQDELATSADGKKTTTILIYGLLALLILAIINFLMRI